MKSFLNLIKFRIQYEDADPDPAEQKRVGTFLGQNLKMTSSSLSEKGFLGETGFTAEEVPVGNGSLKKAKIS